MFNTKFKINLLLFLAVMLTSIIGLQSLDNEVNADSVCVDCEMNNTCVVTCRQNPNGSQTPICGDYGNQPCDCGPPVTVLY